MTITTVDAEAPALSIERFTFRIPEETDGYNVWKLIKSCPPLDENSLYCNLLQCSHFAKTCILAQTDDRALGWVSGYVLPEDPETLFVWQVAVHADARGTGLGKELLKRLVARDNLNHIRHMNTTITATNEASWGMFRSFAKAMDAPIRSAVWLTKEDHFQGLHDAEQLVRIGPFGAGFEDCDD